MATPHITSLNSDLPESHCSFRHTAEASELGLAPGFWPESMTTDLGNKMDFVLEKKAAGYTDYKQIGGCISLRVFND